jgi:hypothetical protein
MGDWVLQLLNKQIVQGQGVILFAQEQLLGIAKWHKFFSLIGATTASAILDQSSEAQVILPKTSARRGENGAHLHRATRLGVALGRRCGGGGEAVAEGRQR